MGDTGYQPYCEKCGAPVVWCTCLDDIDWSLEMRSHLGRVRLEQQVKELRVELARRDEKIAELRSDITGYRRTVVSQKKIITRLKEDAERLVDIADMFGDDAIAVLKHRALMKELE